MSCADNKKPVFQIALFLTGGNNRNSEKYMITSAANKGIKNVMLLLSKAKERRKQKGGMKAVTMLMAACLVCGMGQKAEAAEYTYTLRLFAGAQGVLSDDVIQRITDTGAQVSIENGEISAERAPTWTGC